MKQQRETWIDYARGIAIILVLYRHVFEGIKLSGIPVHDYVTLEHANVLFFSFRMPLFFIVSGIFVEISLRKRGLKEFVKTKMRSILYPYFIWAALQITIQFALSDYVNANRSWYSYLQLFYDARALDQFWYLFALFNATITYVLVNSAMRLSHLQNVALGLILFYISAINYQNKLNLFLVNDILHYYLFIAVGATLSNFFRDKGNLKTLYSWKPVLILLIPFIATQAYFLHENIPYEQMNFEFVEYFQPFAFIVIALTGAAFVIMVSFQLQKANAMKWLHKLGSHSLYIYVAHVMVLACVRIFMTRVLNIYNVPALLICGIVFGLIVPVFLYQMAVRFNIPWIFTLKSSNGASTDVRSRKLTTVHQVAEPGAQ